MTPHPIKEDDLHGLRHVAGRLADAAFLALWRFDDNPDAAAFHCREVHSHFTRLAEILGYTIAPKEGAE